MRRACLILLLFGALAGCKAPLRTAGPKPAARQAQAALQEAVVQDVPVLLAPGYPDVAAVNFYFLGGVLADSALAPGATAFAFEAAIRCGSKKISAELMRDSLAGMGAQLSTQAAPDYCIVKLQCLRRHLPACLDLVLEALSSPALEQAPLQELQDKWVAGLLDNENSTDALLDKQLRDQFLQGHPYARPLGGTPVEIGGLTRAQLLKHYELVRARALMRVCAAGPVSEDDILPALDRHLQGWPLGEPPAAAPPLRHPEPAALLEGAKLPLNYLRGCFDAPAAGAPEALALRLALKVLENRLQADLCQRRNLCNWAGCTYVPGAAGYGIIELPAASPGPVYNAYRSQIKAVAESGLTEEEVAAAKKELLDAYYLAQRTNAGRAALFGTQACWGGGPPPSPAAYAAKLKAIKTAALPPLLAKHLAATVWLYMGNLSKISKKALLPEPEAPPSKSRH